MTEGIESRRVEEFTKLKQLIVENIRNNDVYEREEAVRKILIKQINSLKDCKCSTLISDAMLACRLEPLNLPSLLTTESASSFARAEAGNAK